MTILFGNLNDIIFAVHSICCVQSFALGRTKFVGALSRIRVELGSNSGSRYFSSHSLNHKALVPPLNKTGASSCFPRYKLERENKLLVEIDPWFPSSHICPDCLTQQPVGFADSIFRRNGKLWRASTASLADEQSSSLQRSDLSVREWVCINKRCSKIHDSDEAASRNIRAEGIRILKTDGTAISASGGSVRQDRQRLSPHVRKTKVMQHPAKLETNCSTT